MKDPSAMTSSKDTQICWNKPCLWDDVSMPVPIINPPMIQHRKWNFSRFNCFLFAWLNSLPTVKSSISGRIGIVHPSGLRVAESCPMETKGSTRTVYKYTENIKYISYGRKTINAFAVYPFFSVNFQDIHQIYFDIEQSLLVLGLAKTDCLPSWTSCAHGCFSALIIPLSYLQKKNCIWLYYKQRFTKNITCCWTYWTLSSCFLGAEFNWKMIQLRAKW